MPAPARITPAEALEQYRGLDLNELGRLAHAACLAKHPEPYRTYVVDRNINYANACEARCEFCAFSADAGDERAWAASIEQILDEVRQLVEIGGTQILIQGGMDPTRTLDWYAGLFRRIKDAYPAVHIHGLSPPEIHFIAANEALEVRAVLERLRGAGLDSVPGGGAEILVDRVRRRISPRKCSTDQWLNVMRQAHRFGMRTSATMMLGHVETDAERIEHLRRLRELQDESLAGGAGGFTAFICWTFQPGQTALGRLRAYDWEAGESFDGESLRLAGAHDYLRTLAIARLFLDNFDNLQASWVTQGPKVGQVALFFGANDMGSVMMTEKVVAAAGTTYTLAESDIRQLIVAAGFQPRKRNCHYELLE